LDYSLDKNKGKDMDFVGAIKAGFSNYVNFRGTASRPEYWYWTLFTVLASLISSSIEMVVPLVSISSLFSMATLIPSLAVSVRRLRDAGYSWTWLLSVLPGFVIFIVGIVGIALAAMSSGLLTDPSVLNNQEFLQSAAFQDFVASDPVIGSALLALGGFVLTGMASLVVTIFHIMPSKSYEQGNKRLKPQTPLI